MHDVERSNGPAPAVLVGRFREPSSEIVPGYSEHSVDRPRAALEALKALRQEAIEAVRQEQARQMMLRQELETTRVILAAVLDALRRAEDARDHAIVIAIEALSERVRSQADSEANFNLDLQNELIGMRQELTAALDALHHGTVELNRVDLGSVDHQQNEAAS